MRLFEKEIAPAVTAMQAGGVILYPTDTIWGLGCDATNNEALEKIFFLKNRPSHKSLIILLVDEREIFQYVAAPPPKFFSHLKQFTLPTTFVFDGGIGLAPLAIHEDGSIALRITQDPFCRALIKGMQKPLVSTSANLSGQHFGGCFQHVDQKLITGVDYAVHYRREDNTKRHPSSLYRVHSNGDLSKLR